MKYGVDCIAGGQERPVEEHINEGPEGLNREAIVQPLPCQVCLDEPRMDCTN